MVIGTQGFRLGSGHRDTRILCGSGGRDTSI